MDFRDCIGWAVPFFVWFGDNYGPVLATILFILQAVYQLIRIRNINKYGIRDRRK